MALTTVTSTMTVKPTLTSESDALSGLTLTPTALNPSDVAYTSTSTPPGAEYIGQTETLSGSGAASLTLDLTDLIGATGEAIDGTGKKVQEILVSANASNSAVITVQGGDTDPYELFGAGKSVDIEPGGVLQARFNDKLVDIFSSTAVNDLNIKFSGTGGDEFTYQLILG